MYEPALVEVDREDVAVMFLQVRDTVPEIQECMKRLETSLGELRGRRFFGTVHPESGPVARLSSARTAIARRPLSEGAALSRAQQ